MTADNAQLQQTEWTEDRQTYYNYYAIFFFIGELQSGALPY